MPPNHTLVSTGAADALHVVRPGSAPEPWNPGDVSYMIEPMNMLASRLHSSVCFVGPAQSGKTMALGEGWLAHTVLNDPGDMLIVQMTQDKAREYSRQRIDRALMDSPKLGAMLGRASDDNTHDKLFRNGMWLRIAWPTVSNLSSTSYRYVFCTDYDRVNDDIGGEGDMFTLAGKRTTTFLSRGKLAVESSPGRPILDPFWKPATPHEGPPVKGIGGIYNRSDRRRQYWQCPHCLEFFQARDGLGLFHLPADDELADTIRTLDIETMTRQYARVVCPNSGCIIGFEHRYAMNLGGVWLREGQTIDGARRISGEGRESSIAGFWLGGVAATYVTWEGLIRKYLQAMLHYALTGEEEQLKTTVNVDQGSAFLSMALREANQDKQPSDRRDDGLPQYVVPEGARWVGATVDVQGGKKARFEVEVHAHGPDNQEWVIDRYALRWSKRPGVGTEFAPLDPAAHPEDWDVLTEKVVNASYRTSDPEKNLRVYRVGVDSGGEEGVSENAYAWKRRLRAVGLSNRVFLFKGDPTKSEWYVKETMVGGKTGRNDVPLMLLNSNKLKDIVDARLKRAHPGAGAYYFGSWLKDDYFDQLKAEVRSVEGKWSQIKPRNETFDLCYYQVALAMLVRGKQAVIDWDHPPLWAAPLATNSEVVPRDKPLEIIPIAVKTAEQQPAGRRVMRSSYMG